MNKLKFEKLWNYLTVISVAGTAATLLFVVFLYLNPGSQVNPFPPPTKPAALILPTYTATPLSLPSTWTPIPTLGPDMTVTPVPSATFEIPPSATSGAGAFIPTDTEMPSSAYPFIQQGEVVSIGAFVFNAERTGCDWLGLAGQVHDLQGRPLTGITVQLGGSLNGEHIALFSLTGTALNYGPAGYEFKLADIPADSESTIWVRLLDQSNIPVSERIYFNTFADCQRNLTIINFKQVR